jgi:hypothetical protein
VQRVVDLPEVDAQVEPEPDERAAAQPAASEVDIDELARQVYERLRWQLRIEQERMGRY